MSDEPDVDESKEWEDLEGDDLPTDDVDLIAEQECDVDEAEEEK